MKKRVLALFLCAAVAMSVCACGDGNGTENSQGTESSQAENQAEQPEIVSLAAYDDLSAILTGDYEITEEIILGNYYSLVYNAGIGLVEVTDRDTIQDGDIVKLDYTGYLNGEAFEGGSTISTDGTSNPQYIDVTNNCSVDIYSGSIGSNFIEGFTGGLVGAKKGEKVSHDVTFPENYSSEDLAGQLTTFEFTIHEIYQERTPELLTDDLVVEYLQDVYEVSTVDEFMNFIEEELTCIFVIDYLVTNSEVDIPENYLDERLDTCMDHYIETNFETREMFQSALELYGLTESSIRVQLAESLENQIKKEVVFAEVVKQNNLKVDEAALEEYVQALISINSTIYPDEESVYKDSGFGEAAIGNSYLLNYSAVKESIIEKYGAVE